MSDGKRRSGRQNSEPFGFMALNSRRVLRLSALAAILCAIILPHPATAGGLERRPVYNIAHMTNTIAQVDEAMELGANSIESDVTFTFNGTAAWFYHGVPCDCFRKCSRYQEVPVLLDYIRTTTSTSGAVYSQRLVLLFLDLKVKKVHPMYMYHAGVDIAEKLVKHLWRGVDPWRAMKVLLSSNDGEVLWGAILTIYRFMPLMLRNVGVDISNSNERLGAIRNVYLQLGMLGHRWQGDGTTNCISFMRSASKLQRIIDNRELNHYVEKVYQWTVDIRWKLRRSLRKGVDAIITNRPDRLATILKEDEFRGMARPATIHDNPWTRFGDQSLAPGAPFVDVDVEGDS
ncbi:dermonecrotic toxin SPH-like isoform X2 [Dermacentor variabilis]|uniref:dermonecrotic toxin SPH-like isoform X2 n=1 Tax=Dermacentor variabilis TaxID=34621 RepID=UPI003F5C91AB